MIQNPPNLTPWAGHQDKNAHDLVEDTALVPFSAQSRCWPGGHTLVNWEVPSALLFYPEHRMWLDDWERGPSGAPRFTSTASTAEKSKSLMVRGVPSAIYENGEIGLDTIGFIEHPLRFVDNKRSRIQGTYTGGNMVKSSDSGKRSKSHRHGGGFPAAVKRLGRGRDICKKVRAHRGNGACAGSDKWL